MDHYIKIGIIIFLSFLVPNLIIKFVKKGTNDKKIKPSKVLISIGAVGITLGLSIIYLLVIQNETTLAFFPTIFIILGIYLIMYRINWEIILKEEVFIYKNILGKSKEYSYNDIVDLIDIRQGLKLILKDKVIKIDLYVQNVNLLLDKINLKR